MSKIALVGNGSGTATFTIAAPNTNVNRTLDLPDRSGALAQYGPVFRANRNADITGLTTNVSVQVIFNTEQFDTDNCYDTTTGRFTPNVAGYYEITAQLTAQAGTSMSHLSVALRKNGTAFADAVNSGYATVFSRTIVSGIGYANGTTDYFDVAGTVTGTGALSILATATPVFCVFQGRFVRP